MRRLRLNFWIESWQVDAMKGIMTRDGVLVSEQIRRAITAYLKTKGVNPRATTDKTRKGRA